jgi:hypothetical protein
MEIMKRVIDIALPSPADIGERGEELALLPAEQFISPPSVPW